MSSIPKEDQFSVIRKEYPYYEKQFQSLRDFQLYVMNFWMSVYVFLAIFGCIQSGATIGYSVLQMIRILHEVKLLISKETWKKHRMSVRNLVLQITYEQLLRIIREIEG
uniref:Odorant receptor n=1 Tax=Caenorhabditis tropicalis TaxID=1561998 RepID=A0A1I7UK94_9PELO